MEIKEVVSFYVNEDAKTIEVEFRLISDSDNEIRMDILDIDEMEDYGYNVYSDEYDFFGELSKDYSDEDLEESVEDKVVYDIQEEDLKNFISEYYTSNKNRLPDSEIF